MNLGAHKPWIKLAQLNVILGEPESACTFLSEATDYEPKLWEIWKDLAAMSADCCNFEKAANSYGKVVSLNPTYRNEEILKAIISSLVHGNLEKTVHERVSASASRLLEELNKRFPNDIHYWALLGVATAANPNPCDLTKKTPFEMAMKSLELFESPTNYWYKFDHEVGGALKTSQLIVDCLVNISHLLHESKESEDCLKVALSFIGRVTKTLDEYHSDFLTASVRPVFLDHYDLLLEKASKMKLLMC